MKIHANVVYIFVIKLMVVVSQKQKCKLVCSWCSDCVVVSLIGRSVCKKDVKLIKNCLITVSYIPLLPLKLSLLV